MVLHITDSFAFTFFTILIHNIYCIRLLCHIYFPKTNTLLKIKNNNTKTHKNNNAGNCFLQSFETAPLQDSTPQKFYLEYARSIRRSPSIEEVIFSGADEPFSAGGKLK